MDYELFCFGNLGFLLVVMESLYIYDNRQYCGLWAAFVLCIILTHWSIYQIVTLYVGVDIRLIYHMLVEHFYHLGFSCRWHLLLEMLYTLLRGHLETSLNLRLHEVGCTSSVLIIHILHQKQSLSIFMWAIFPMSITSPKMVSSDSCVNILFIVVYGSSYPCLY